MPEVTSTTGGVNVTLLPSCYMVIDMIGEPKSLTSLVSKKLQQPQDV